MNNIYTLGCQDKTYWCFTKGYKKCDFKNGHHNLSFNWKIICEFCIRKNFQNILILEDDLLITNKLWNNYFEKKKKILEVINNNKNECLVFHFGQLPIISIPINQYIARGLNFNTQCILINQLTAKEYLKIYSQKFRFYQKYYHVDTFYLFKNKFKKYNLIPNNIFFQKSNINSSSSSSSIFYRSQYLITGRIYYQYDPKFVSFWELIRGFTILTFLLIILVVIILCVLFGYVK